jgi:hypothetical protein
MMGIQYSSSILFIDDRLNFCYPSVSWIFFFNFQKFSELLRIIQKFLNFQKFFGVLGVVRKSELFNNFRILILEYLQIYQMAFEPQFV